MSLILRNPFSGTAIPLMLLAATYILIPYSAQLPGQLLQQLPYIPYLIMAAVCALGLIYRKPRSTLIALLLGITYWGLSSTPSAFFEISRPDDIQRFHAILGLLIPFLILMITCLKDQHVSSLTGLLALGLFTTLSASLVWLRKEDSELLDNWLFAEFMPELELSAHTSLPQPVLTTLLVASLITLLLIIKRKKLFEGAFLTSMLSVGLALNNGMNPNDSAILFTLAELILLASLIQHAYFIAYIDDLTELPGRRALNEALTHMRGSYAIAMLDVDHFKKFNDTHGHDVGDQVLRMVASKMKRLPAGAKAYRYGGEEFCILWPGKSCGDALPHLSRLRQTIEEAQMVLRQKNRSPKKTLKRTGNQGRRRKVRITISIGVAERSRQHTSTEAVIKAADQALYQAKANGRNQVSQYGAPVRKNGKRKTAKA